MKLSKRLQTILDLIDPCETLVDVGTDHGYILIKAIIENKCKKAYGLDIASGPLSFARHNKIEYGLEKEIELMQMDGLKAFNKDADFFVIAGMGHETILSILNHYAFNEDQTLILQSNTKIYDLRIALNNSDFKIIDERFLYDNNKPITILKVKKGKETLDEQSLYLGPFLKREGNPEYITYLSSEFAKIKHVIKYNKDYLKRYEYLKTYLKEMR